MGSPTEAKRKKTIWASKAAFSVGNNWAFAHRNRKRVKGMRLKEQDNVMKEQAYHIREQAYSRDFFSSGFTHRSEA